jgi:hypothetical protein
MKPSILASYAILKVNWEQPLQKDYLDNFVLLVSEAIRHLHQDIISLPELQAEINSRFGINIPQNTINSLLKRIAKRGYIHISHKIYTRDIKKLETLNFAKIQQNVMQSYESLLDGLIKFCKEKYNLNWTAEIADKHLIEYLQENQIILLSELISNASGKIPQLPSIEPEPQYIIAKYIEFLQESYSSGLDFLETVVKGNLLANSIFLTEPGQYQRRFINTSVYIDSPLAIFALGYAGEPRKYPIAELISLLKSYGAQLKIFRHSLEEIIGILSACAERIRRKQYKDSYGPSIEYFLGVGLSETDIMMFLENLEANLSKLGISVVDRPPYNDYSINIDEEEFCKYLQDKVSYIRETALERDKDSIAAILRLRKGQSYVIYEECQALFVTSNLSLANCARYYPDFNYQVGTVPLVLSDYELTNLVWLKNPSLSPNLPRRRLIADSYASTQPRESLWSKYLDTIDRLKKDGKISPDQYFILRHSIQAKSELMEKTRNNERIFTEGTVDEILQSVESRIRADDIAKLNAETQARLKAIQDFENEREARIKLREKIEQNERERLLRINQRASTTAKFITSIIEILLAVLLIYLTYIVSPFGPLDITRKDLPNLLKVISLFVYLILLILEIINTIWGIGPKIILGRLKDILTHVIEKFLNP